MKQKSFMIQKVCVGGLCLIMATPSLGQLYSSPVTHVGDDLHSHWVG